MRKTLINHTSGRAPAAQLGGHVFRGLRRVHSSDICATGLPGDGTGA
jgi:hypothetical protein